MAIIVGTGEYRYRIVEDWATLPDGWSFKEVGAVGVEQDPPSERHRHAPDDDLKRGRLRVPDRDRVSAPARKLGLPVSS